MLRTARVALVAILTTFLSSGGSSQFVFLPPGLNFPPLRANMRETRIGVFKFLDAGNLKLDTGNSIDLIGYGILDEGTRITAGIDFTAYALATGSDGLRLQIDALDGIFGGNVSISRTEDRGILQWRLRIYHGSSHVVEGHYSSKNQQWLGGRCHSLRIRAS